MAEPVVKIVCGAKGCNRVLATLSTTPGRGQSAQTFPPEGDPEWSDSHRVVWADHCSRHGGVPGTLDELNERRAELGLPPADVNRLMHAIPWRELRPAYDESRHTGRASYFPVSPQSRTI